MKTHNQDKALQFYNRLGMSLIILGVLVALIGFRSFGKDYNWKELNLLGDYLSGAVGSLWTLAGTIFIIRSFIQQKQDLIQQRKDFERQAFDNTFFSLLSTLKSSLTEIEQKLATESGGDGFKSTVVDLERLDNPEKVLESPKNKSVLKNLTLLLIQIMIRIDTESKRVLNKEDSIQYYSSLIKGSLNEYQKKTLKICINYYYSDYQKAEWMSVLDED